MVGALGPSVGCPADVAIGVPATSMGAAVVTFVSVGAAVNGVVSPAVWVWAGWSAAVSSYALSGLNPLSAMSDPAGAAALG